MQFHTYRMKTKLIKVLRALKFALKGIIYAIKNERNMRIHTIASIYVLIFSLICNLKPLEYIVVIITIGIVLTAEMFNSAIESIIDLCSEQYNSIAKAAKDISAGGVLILASAAFTVGAILFFNQEKLLNIARFIYDFPVSIFIFAFSLIPSYYFIFLGPTEIKNKMQNINFKIKKKISNIKDDK